MTLSPWPTDAPLQSFVRDQIGPTYRDLRPGKPDLTPTFPVYQELSARLVDKNLTHPDPMVAQVLATAAGYAYSDVGTVSMMMTRLGLERSRCRQVSRLVDAMLINATAHLVQSQDRRLMIVAFRGTPPLDLITWFLNADVYPEAMASVANASGHREPFQVHAGFYRNVRLIRAELITALLRAYDKKSILGEPADPSLTHLTEPDAPSARREEAAAPTTDQEVSSALGGDTPATPDDQLDALYITGHSLGGAMAAMFAAMLLMSDNDDYRRIASKLKAVYTFGQPMIGFNEFATAAGDAFDAAGVPLLRYVYEKDPVPLLPPDAVGDYVHFGQEYRLSADGTWAPTVSSTRMPALVGVATSLLSYGAGRIPGLRDLPFRYKVEDHFPHHYVSALIPPGHTDEFGDYFPQPASAP
jgi:hypothetical protein